jgi:hypothetical protein
VDDCAATLLKQQGISFLRAGGHRLDTRHLLLFSRHRWMPLLLVPHCVRPAVLDLSSQLTRRLRSWFTISH